MTNKKGVFLLCAVAAFWGTSCGTPDKGDDEVANDIIINELGCADLTERRYRLVSRTRDAAGSAEVDADGQPLGGHIDFMHGNIFFLNSSYDVSWSGWHLIECVDSLITVSIFRELELTVNSTDGFDHLSIIYNLEDGSQMEELYALDGIRSSAN